MYFVGLSINITQNHLNIFPEIYLDLDVTKSF